MLDDDGGAPEIVQLQFSAAEEVLIRYAAERLGKSVFVNLKNIRKGETTRLRPNSRKYSTHPAQ